MTEITDPRAASNIDTGDMVEECDASNKMQTEMPEQDIATRAVKRNVRDEESEPSKKFCSNLALNKFGFIVMDGNGALFGIQRGNTKEVLHKFTVDLPKKHGGGNSAMRFARLRKEKRDNYVTKVAETAVQMYIINDQLDVAGLILAGCGEFKTELAQSSTLDQRLQAKILQIVDVSYGGEDGFNQAVELVAESLEAN